MKQYPLVSIITVTLNSRQYLEETIKSVLSQTYKNIEYIIIDGGSTDGTIEIIEKYSEHIKYWVSEPDSGLYDAMNKGIKKASGSLIGILNSDDLYSENAVSEVVNKFLQIQIPCVLYGDMLIFTDCENKPRKYILNRGDLSPQAFANLTFYTSMNHPTCFVHKQLYSKYGVFSDKYQVGADRDLLLTFYNNKVDFVYVNSILCKFRLGGKTSNLTINNIFSRSILEEYDILLMNQVPFIARLSRVTKEFLKSFVKLLLSYFLKPQQYYFLLLNLREMRRK